ncbi:GntR family transcriptional regulator [Salinicola peritrichatus]|uniref:GntR family transcriptional regulator n=1 Tax=Salinicola peritrichatus TaxID=1267424 RepID=UPI000DA23EB8|nr:GntR family transcriptional regulator [Salinicola peritrichatus]
MNSDESKLPHLTQVSRITLKDQVYRQLREALMSGRFKPGQKLTIRGLSEALGASQMPVREALHRLSAENAFKETKTGRIRIRSMNTATLREIRDARVALEGLLLERAARRLNDEDMTEIRQAYDDLQTAANAGDTQRYLRTNFAFHRRIYQAADAELTMAAVENFWLHMGPCFALVAPDSQHLERSMLAHSRILEALYEHDEAAARAAVTEDIMEAAASLETLLKQLNFPDRKRSAQ